MTADRTPGNVPSRPAHQYDFFISHVAEDTEDVKRLKSEIIKRTRRRPGPELNCFLDSENWEIGTDAYLYRHYLLKSRFMIAWITPSYLKNKRGWVWFELRDAEILEERYNAEHGSASGLILYYIAPVFRGVGMKQVDPTPLHRYSQRGLLKTGREYSLAQIAKTIIAFYDQEIRKRTSPPAGPPQ